MQNTRKVGTHIIVVTVCGIIALAVLLEITMVYFLNRLSDDILLNTLRATAKTAAIGVEENLHVLADRMYNLRDTNNFDIGSTEVRGMYLELARNGTEYVWLAIYNLDGAIEVGTDSSPAGISDWDLFGELKRTNNLCIGDTRRTEEGLEIVVGLPIQNGANKTAHYIIGSFKYDLLRDVLSGTNIGVNSYTYIVNREAIVMAHMDADLVLTKSALNERFKSEADYEAFLKRENLAQTGALRLMTKGGGKSYLCYAPVRGANWALVIAASAADFNRPVSSAIWITILFTGFLIIVISIVILTLLSRIVARPLALISVSAAHMAKGVLTFDIPERLLNRRDEIGEFSRAFSDISATVGKLSASITDITDSAREGRLYARANTAQYSGDYSVMVTGVNGMLDVFCAHLDSVPEAIALLDSDSCIVYYNHSMSRLLRRHELAPHDVSIVELMTGGEPDFSHSDVFTAECGLDSVDAGYMHYSLSIRKLASGYILIMNDITRLAEALLAAEAANVAKSRFLSRMSHELLTPMNAVIGMGKLARANVDDAAQRIGTSNLLIYGQIDKTLEYLDRSNAAAARLLAVVNDILDYSEIEDGTLTLTPACFSLAEEIKAAVSAVSDGSQGYSDGLSRGVTIETDVDITHGAVTTDAMRLNQVISNLLSNAVKYSKDRGVVRLKCFESGYDEESGRATFDFSVSDNGRGITHGEKCKLFKPFEQVDDSMSRTHGGTGLGLVISKNIVELMEGGIGVESVPGEGSTFWFTVRIPAAESATDIIVDVDFTGKRCMIVDDVDINREIIAALLEDTGLECETAEDGMVALDMFANHAPGYYDIILMDLQMPVLDGFAATRKIRSLASERADAAHIPIIALTANITREDIVSSKEAGMDAHLAKPVELGVTLKTMGDLLRRNI